VKTFRYLVLGSFMLLTLIIALNGTIAAVALFRTAGEATLRLLARSGSCFVLALMLLAWTGIAWKRLRAPISSRRG